MLKPMSGEHGIRAARDHRCRESGEVYNPFDTLSTETETLFTIHWGGNLSRRTTI